MSSVLSAIGPEGYGAHSVEWQATGPNLIRSDHEADGYLVPGFIDIHIHGAFGTDFMDAEAGSMRALCERLAELGYEGLLPTTVAATAGDVLGALDSLEEHQMLLGFHLEGPFLSPSFPGAQPSSAIVEPPSSASEWDEILDHPKLKVITIAPEQPGSSELIRRLSHKGVLVSMGHSNATFAEARRGFDAGAQSATHTFNAMRPFHHRAAGLTGFVLSRDELYAELIYDRSHVSREAAGLLFKCKPANRVIAVSDSTRASGMRGGTEFEMWGQRCVVGDRVVHLKGTDTLAGSAITLLDAFRNLAEDFGPETAIRACCLNPREAIHLPAVPKVWVEFDSDLAIRAIHRSGSLE